MRIQIPISRRALLGKLGSVAMGLPFFGELVVRGLVAEAGVSTPAAAGKIVRKDSSVFNGAHCEEGVRMRETQADAHLLKNSHVYIGYVTLKAQPGVVFFARVGACLFENMRGCTAHVLTSKEAKQPDAAQPALASARTVYMRPGQATFLPKFQLFQTGAADRLITSASECIEGGLGSCWLMAAIASVAEHPGAIPRLFRKRPAGYDVKLFDTKARRWNTYSINDALPACRSGSNFSPAYAKPGEADAPSVWPCLLEKAFAVAMGNSYLRLNGGYSSIALEMLTGARPTNLYPMKISVEDLHDGVSDYLRTDHAVTASSRFFDRTTVSDLVFKGQIAQLHAYSILGSRKTKDGVSEFQIRNPWGRLGLSKPGAALQNQTDGTFWMPARSIAEHFSTITVAKVK